MGSGGRWWAWRASVGLAVWMLLLAGAAAGEQDVREGRVVDVRDGDTVVVSSAGNLIAVRITEIDAPELRQPYGLEARRALLDLVAGKTIVLHVTGRDRYDRTLAALTADGRDVAAVLVEVGAAWVYRQYSDDPRLRELEADARQTERGLWGLAEVQRVAPWEWRARQRRGEIPPRRILATVFP